MSGPDEREVTSFLALCARSDPYPGMADRLLRASATIDWDGLPGRAEAHGLEPLVHVHLETTGIAVPARTRERLRARRVQHAHASRVRARALAEILTLYGDLDIDVLLLKGAAVAHLAYPQPALRPMRDLDLLVPGAEAGRAQAALATVGFSRSPSPMHGLDPRHHHLAAVSRVEAGVSVSVEVHRGLILRNGRRATVGFDDLVSRAQAVSGLGVPARTLGPEDLLWHVYRHAFNAVTREPLRLIAVADCVSLVERGIDGLDWDRMRREYPAVLRMLPVLQTVAPLQDVVIARLGLPATRASALDRPVRPFGGWPPIQVRGQTVVGLGRLVRDVLFPPSWWVRVAYGRGASRLDYGRAWLAHIAMLAGTVWHVTRKQTVRVAAGRRRRAFGARQRAVT
jgi:hypothetical protein